VAGGNSTQATAIKAHDLSGATLELGSALGSLTAADYVGRSSARIQVPRIGMITITGDPANDLAGDFGPALVVGAGSLGASAVGTVTVAGELSGTWDVQGTVTSVTSRDTDLWTLGPTGPFAVYPGQVGDIKTLSLGSLQESAITSAGHVATLKAVEMFSDTLSAVSLGALTMTGSADRSRAGSLANSTITLTGHTGAGQVGLGTVAIKGVVASTTIMVQAGNVTSFTSARFLSSHLYAGYQPGSHFQSTGVFTAVEKIGTFKTTGQPLTPGITDPLTAAFEDSVVVAARVGKVRLSTLSTANSGVLFGFKVKSLPGNVGSFRVATQPFNPAVSYTPSPTGDVSPGVGGLASLHDFRFFVQP
jgi:hypothetical protein